MRGRRDGTVCWMELQLSVQSVPITTKVVISNHVHAGEKYSIQRYVIKFVNDWVTLVFSTNKTDHHDITEILLKVGLHTIKQPTNQSRMCYQYEHDKLHTIAAITITEQQF